MGAGAAAGAGAGAGSRRGRPLGEGHERGNEWQPLPDSAEPPAGQVGGP